MTILDKINFCLNNLAEPEWSIYSPYRYNDNWRLQLVGKTVESDEIKLVVQDVDLASAIDIMYNKVRNLVTKMPEFDANKAITHVEPPTPADEIPF